MYQMAQISKIPRKSEACSVDHNLFWFFATRKPISSRVLSSAQNHHWYLRTKLHKSSLPCTCRRTWRHPSVPCSSACKFKYPNQLHPIQYLKYIQNRRAIAFCPHQEQGLNVRIPEISVKRCLVGLHVSRQRSHALGRQVLQLVLLAHAVRLEPRRRSSTVRCFQIVYPRFVVQESLKKMYIIDHGVDYS